MRKSDDASYDNQPEIWDYIKDNPRLMGLPLSNNKGLDICSALRDIYMVLNDDVPAAKHLLSLLATVLVGSAEGQGEEIIEEVMVIEAMQNLDKKLKGILDEGH